MNQDAYVFQRLKLGDIGLSEHLDSGIRKMRVAGQQRPGPDHCRSLARHAHRMPSGTPLPQEKRKISLWHAGFGNTVDLAEEGNRLFPLARHVAIGQGLTYPTVNEINRDAYINDLAVPGGRLSYDQVFDKAIRHVIEGWHLVAKGVFEDDALIPNRLCPVESRYRQGSDRPRRTLELTP
jgi:hypothetical protein